MKPTHFRYHEQDGIDTLTPDRPERLNALASVAFSCADIGAFSSERRS